MIVQGVAPTVTATPPATAAAEVNAPVMVNCGAAEKFTHSYRHTIHTINPHIHTCTVVAPLNTILAGEVVAMEGVEAAEYENVQAEGEEAPHAAGTELTATPRVLGTDTGT